MLIGDPARIRYEWDTITRAQIHLILNRLSRTVHSVPTLHAKNLSRPELLEYHGDLVVLVKLTQRFFLLAYALFVMCASFLLPLFIIIAAYGSMFRVAMRHTRDQTHRANAECQRHHNRFKRDLKAAKTIGFVIGTFLCCWAPFIFVSVAYAFFPEINQVYASFTKWLSYLNAVLSPVVYTCVDKQLRCLVWKRLSKCCPKNRKGFISTKHERSFATSEYSRSTPLAIV